VTLSRSEKNRAASALEKLLSKSSNDCDVVSAGCSSSEIESILVEWGRVSSRPVVIGKITSSSQQAMNANMGGTVGVDNSYTDRCYLIDVAVMWLERNEVDVYSVIDGFYREGRNATELYVELNLSRHGFERLKLRGEGFIFGCIVQNKIMLSDAA